MRSEEIKAKAIELGFDLAGVASMNDPTLSAAIVRYTEWLDRGNGASMEYLRRHVPLKAHPERLLPACKSILCVGLFYGDASPRASVLQPSVSLYARGNDYHEEMGRMLQTLVGWLASHGVQARPFVDAEPVLERFWAWRAGLGWVGRHSIVINRKLGSYFFLGGALVDVALAPDEPGTDHCGSCRKCVEACPTSAIMGDRTIDSLKCIGYHTVENKGTIPERVMEASGIWIAGCDICQSVCPWNEPKSGAAHARRDKARFATVNPVFAAELRELARWDATEFARNVRGTALQRLKYPMFIRNVAIAIANSGLPAAAKREALGSLERSVAALPEGPGRQGATEAIDWVARIL